LACPVRSETKGVETKTFNEGRHAVTVYETPVGAVRTAHLRSEQGNTSFLVEHPLKTEEDYRTWTWIEEHTTYEVDLGQYREHLRQTEDEGVHIGMLLPRGKSAFQQMVEHLVGTEELAYALCDFPDTVEELWSAMVRKDLEAVRLSSETGAYQYFLSWEDSGTQNYSPSQYDKYIGSEISQWCEVLRGNGQRYVQHACGHVRDLVERMRDHGVYAVESLSPPPTGNVTLKEARNKVGSKMGIIGGIEPTRFLYLSESELGDYVEQVIADGAGGPFVLANSDSCPPGVSVEKFRLVAELSKVVF